MNKKRIDKSKHIDFMFWDIVCVQVSLMLAYFIWIGDDKYSTFSDYSLINMLIILVHLVLVLYREIYSGILRRGYLKELKNIVVHNLQLLAIVLVVLFFGKISTDYSRVILALFVIINVVATFTVRSLWKKHIWKKKDKKSHASRLLVVAESDKIKDIIDGLNSYGYSAFSIVGAVVSDEDKTGEVISDVDVVSSFEGMYEYVKCNVIDEVLVCCGENQISEISNTLLSMGVVVHININAAFHDLPNATLNHVNNYPVVTTSINTMTFGQKVLKRLMDIGVSIIGILITVILYIIFGPIIYIQSPGPILFKQLRVGKNGRQFKIYKFRSMYMDAEERKKELMEKNKMSGLMFKMDDDPRITPIGKFIRKTSIDEFPQFFNIFKGDMSLVGTRPPTVDEYNMYEQHHKSRLAMKPGLTGMWQVSGRSEITDFEEVVRLDNEYIRNFSLSLDIKILAKTFVAVLRRKGSV